MQTLAHVLSRNLAQRNIVSQIPDSCQQSVEVPSLRWDRYGRKAAADLRGGGVALPQGVVIREPLPNADPPLDHARLDLAGGRLAKLAKLAIFCCKRLQIFGGSFSAVSKQKIARK